MGLDFEALALAHGTPRARDLSGGSGAVRAGSLLSHVASFMAAKATPAPQAVNEGNDSSNDDDGGLTVSSRPLAQLYLQPPILEGGELEPVFRSLLKRDRDLVIAGKLMSTGGLLELSFLYILRFHVIRCSSSCSAGGGEKGSKRCRCSIEAQH
jgi:hypothetical protein